MKGRPKSERPEHPGLEAIKLSVQMMNAPGAPSFPTKPEKIHAMVDLAQALSRSRTRGRKCGSATDRGRAR
jgi:hypothetical protein